MCGQILSGSLQYADLIVKELAATTDNEGRGTRTDTKKHRTSTAILNEGWKLRNKMELDGKK